MSSKGCGSSSPLERSRIRPTAVFSSNSPSGSRSSGKAPGEMFELPSYGDVARLDDIGALPNSGVIADDLDNSLLVGGGIANAPMPASHGIADDLIAVAAMKSVDDGRQNGFVEGKPQQYAANAPHVRHVFGKPRRTVCRRQRMLEGQLSRPRLEIAYPVRQ